MTLDESNHMNPCQKCGGDCKNPIPECPDYGIGSLNNLPNFGKAKKYDYHPHPAGMGETDYSILMHSEFLCSTDTRDKVRLIITALNALDNQKEMQESMKHG